MLTLKELIEDLDVNVLTGESNLDQAVRWVHMSELTDPTPWLSGGELLLTTGLQLDSAQVQRELMERLVERKLAGLGFGTGLSHDQVPKPLIEIAQKHDFPIFEVPYEVPFIAITEKAFTRLVNEQYDVLRQALVAHEQLEKVVLSEGGLEGIAAALSSSIGSSIRFYDVRAELLVEQGFHQPLVDKLGKQIHSELQGRLEAANFDEFDPAGTDLAERAAVVPVASSGVSDETEAAPQAWLAAVKDSGKLSELDRLVVHQAVTVVALELLRKRVAEDTERRLAGNVLADIISGDLVGAELGRRLEPFGISDRVAAVVLQPTQPDPEVLKRCQSTMMAGLRDEVSGCLVAVNGPSVAALLPGIEDGDLMAITERLIKRVSEELDGVVLAGVGRSVPAADARRTYHEARWAIEARTLAEVPEDGSVPLVASYKDLGSFQLLLALQDDEALRLFCDSVLAPIEAGEGHYGDELLRSLEAFIEENGQWERAARRLYCHRHTLRYRIRKIEELTGRSLQNARDRIEFWLALRGRELVG